MPKKKIKKTTKRKAKVKAKGKKNSVGRPPLDTKLLADKLEPYIKIGLSMRKACALAGVHRDTISIKMKEDDNFRAKILSYRAYKSVLMGNITIAKIMDIADQVAKAKKMGMSLRTALTKNDQYFLQIMMRYDRSLREEWGDKLTDEDEDEAKKVQFDKPTTKREADLQARVLNKHHDYINKGKKVDEESDR